MSLVCLILAGLGCLTNSELFGQDQTKTRLDPEQVKFFESRIRPVLVRECYSCHSNQVGQVKGGLWLDGKEGLLVGGDSGPAIVPNNLEESLLWNAINHIDYSMPPRKKLSDEVLQDFREWIEMGAPDPRENSEETVSSSITSEDIKKGREFWSFKPPQRSSAPEVKDLGWAKTEIDQFVFAGLSAKGLQPAADADPNTLLRRLCFDLTGLPPTPKQSQRFSSDWKKNSEKALEEMVDSLLAQPQYGERWGRHWLDIARYAESSGRELNLTFPNAWRYRDYVIDSFNQDKPYDEFVVEQIAGDLLPIDSDKEWAENLVATGFMAVGPKGLREQNPRQFELDLVDEQIDVTTRVMLGVSVACARCHDHKFDPIPQTDYYALAGIFRGMSTHYGTAGSLQNRRPSNLIVLPIEDLVGSDRPLSTKKLKEMKAELEEKQLELRQALLARRAGQNNKQPNPQLARIPVLSASISALESQINSYDAKGNPLTVCMAVQETNPMDSRLLERGELNKPAQVVPRGLPQVLCADPPVISKDSTGRLEFARWIGSEKNPLTARVMANRVWQHLFVNGIVRTPDDFASTGEAPTHPELLDYLAVSFMENNWSLKQLIRKIVLSRTYRMSSQFNEASFQKDPENRLCWRMEPRRLEAEAIRDAMLFVSGVLDTQRPRASLIGEVGHAQVNNGRVIAAAPVAEMASMGSSSKGPSSMGSSSIGSPAPAGPLARGLGGRQTPRFVMIDQPTSYRSVYLPIVRDNIPRSLEVFDFAESSLVISQRETSHTPDQGLYFLNNQTVMELSDTMARRLIKESSNLNVQIKSAFLWAYGRPATEAEIKAAVKFHKSFDVNPLRADYQADDRADRRTADRLRELRKQQAQRYARPSAKRPDNGMPRAQAMNRNQSGVSSQEMEVKKLSAVCQAIMASAEFRIVN
jgi:hypothetical protein